MSAEPDSSEIDPKPRRLIGIVSTPKGAESTTEVNITHIVHSNDEPRKGRLSGGITVLRLEESNESKLPNAPLSHGIFCSSAWVHESSRFDSSARTILTASAKTGAAE